MKESRGGGHNKSIFRFIGHRSQCFPNFLWTHCIYVGLDMTTLAKYNKKKHCLVVKIGIKLCHHQAI